MVDLRIGSTDITAVKLGASAVSKVYVGATQVFPQSGLADWNPTMITGPTLRAWWWAGDIATITKDGSNLVAAWNDKSSRANHATQATAASKPLYTATNANFGNLATIGNIDAGDGLVLVENIGDGVRVTSDTSERFNIAAMFTADTGTWPLAGIFQFRWANGASSINDDQLWINDVLYDTVSSDGGMTATSEGAMFLSGRQRGVALGSDFGRVFDENGTGMIMNRSTDGARTLDADWHEAVVLRGTITEAVRHLVSGYLAWNSGRQATLTALNKYKTGKPKSDLSVDGGRTSFQPVFVGMKQGTIAGSTTVGASVALSSGLTGGIAAAVAAGDLVIVSYSVGHQARTPACTINDPSAVAYPVAISDTANTADTQDVDCRIAAKFMPGTPDATVELLATGNAADGGSYHIRVYRGVNVTTPLDVAVVTANGINTGIPDPGAITPTDPHAMIVVFGCGGAATGAVFTQAGLGELTDFQSNNIAATNDVSQGSGDYPYWTTGAFNPAAFTGGSNNANNSWLATTLALRSA